MKKLHLFRSLSSKVAAMCAGLIVLATLSSGILGYFYLRNAYIQNTQSEVMNIAKTVAVNIDADEYGLMVELDTPGDYWSALKQYFDAIKEETDLKYLYALDNNSDGLIKFIVEGQSREDDPNMICQFGDVLEEGSYTSGLFECLRTGNATIGDIHEVDPFGTMVSGYAPIIDSSGKIVGVIGADIGVDRILSDVYNQSLVYIAITSGIAVVVAIVLFIYIRQTVGKPISDIVNAANKLVNDDFRELEVDSISAETSEEMKSLVHSFSEVVEKSKRPDSLTRTYGRSAGIQMLKRILKDKSSKASYCVAFADLNKLKSINDNFGHTEGDYALRVASDSMLYCVRDGDIVSRYGGDEFLIIFEKCNYEQARSIMSRIQRRLKDVSTSAEKPYVVEFSYGLLEVKPGDYSNPEELIAELDKLMYKDKHGDNH